MRTAKVLWERPSCSYLGSPDLEPANVDSNVYIMPRSPHLRKRECLCNDSQCSLIKLPFQQYAVSIVLYTFQEPDLD